MKKNIVLISFLLLGFLFPQRETHRWTPLVVNENQKVWYDNNQIDAISIPKFDIWLLEVHSTPLKIETIVSGVMRTKTLYTINLETMSYGIKEVVYYDINNKEIKRFQYEIEELEDKWKYSYPILDNSIVGQFIKMLSGKK